MLKKCKSCESTYWSKRMKAIAVQEQDPRRKKKASNKACRTEKSTTNLTKAGTLKVFGFGGIDKIVCCYLPSVGKYQIVIELSKQLTKLLPPSKEELERLDSLKIAVLNIQEQIQRLDQSNDAIFSHEEEGGRRLQVEIEIISKVFRDMRKSIREVEACINDVKMALRYWKNQDLNQFEQWQVLLNSVHAILAPAEEDCVLASNLLEEIPKVNGEAVDLTDRDGINEEVIQNEMEMHIDDMDDSFAPGVKNNNCWKLNKKKSTIQIKNVILIL